MKLHHLQVEKGEVGQFVILPGDPGRCELIANHFENPKLIAKRREYTTYTGTHKGLKVSVTSTGMGCPSAAIALEELIMAGTKYFIRLGSTGALQKELNPGSIIIGNAAVRTDGTSLEYIPEEFPAIADIDVTTALVKAVEEKDIKKNVGIIWSHDAFYKGSIFADPNYLEREKIWIDSNVLCVDNESSALFTISYLRKVKAGSILTVLGNHITKEMTTDKEATIQNLHNMTELCLRAFEILGDRE